MTGSGRCGKNGRVDQVGAPRRSGIWGCHVTSAAVNQQSGAGTRRLFDGATAWPATPGPRAPGPRAPGPRAPGSRGRPAGSGDPAGGRGRRPRADRLGPRRRVRQCARRRRDGQLRHAPARCGTSRTARARPRDDQGQSAPDSACSAAAQPRSQHRSGCFPPHRFSALLASGPRLTRIRHQVPTSPSADAGLLDPDAGLLDPRPALTAPVRQRHQRPRYRRPRHQCPRHPLRRTRPHRHRGSVRCLRPRIGYRPQPRAEAGAVRDAGWRTAGRRLAQRGRRHRRGRRAPARAAPPPAGHRLER